MYADYRPVFITTVDTEEEWDWSGDFPRPPFSTKNIQCLPEFQDFCQRIAIRPTYFVDHAVIEKPENQAILARYFSADTCDIGAHLHPWCTPPIDEEICDKNSHAVNLDLTLFRRKMVELTDGLAAAFGRHPTSFRSGRWGLNGKMLQVLAELGYKIDSSVRPYYSDTAFSYDGAMTVPYWPSFGNVLEPGEQREILEIPATSGYNHPNFESLDNWGRKLRREPIRRLKIVGILSKLGWFNKIALTPEDQTLKEMCRSIDVAVKRRDPVLNLFFHSSDLMPGNTEYVKTEADKVAFYDRIEQCVSHARNRYNAEFLTITEAYERFEGSVPV
ncbi:MAG: polysaccharide deacetylase family protein [Granulosicoccus sp.]|nr:polysaccharide deacetylase family protein [Granulosicoccus sp.]